MVEHVVSSLVSIHCPPKKRYEQLMMVTKRPNFMIAELIVVLRASFNVGWTVLMNDDRESANPERGPPPRARIIRPNARLLSFRE